MRSVCTGVVVFHRSMVNWRREWGLPALGMSGVIGQSTSMVD